VISILSTGMFTSPIVWLLYVVRLHAFFLDELHMLNQYILMFINYINSNQTRDDRMCITTIKQQSRHLLHPVKKMRGAGDPAN
jgi:hypothetical protein